MTSLNNLFYPKSLAVIGASTDSSKIGNIITKNIIESRYSGGLYLVNPKGGVILNQQAVSSVSDINVDLDLAIVCIPAKLVVQSLEELGQKKCRFAIVVAAGFKEVGEDGLHLENKILEIAKKYNIRIVGPNCLGIINMDSSFCLNGSFDFFPKTFGNVSIISQSGALISILIDEVCKSGAGLQKVISMGNKSDLNENDFIEFLAEDKKTDVIGVYLESFCDGKRLCEIIKKSPKPVVVFKVGSSKRAQQAAMSHTGSLAGDDMVARSHLLASGAYLVDSVEDFSLLLSFISFYHDRLGVQDADEFSQPIVITNAGGVGVATLDAMSRLGLEPKTIDTQMESEIKMLIPQSGSAHNPIDILGDAPAKRYCDTLKHISLLTTNPILLIATPQINTEVEKTAKQTISIIQDSDSIVLPIFMGDDHVVAGRKLFYSNNIVCFSYPDDALAVIKNISNTLSAVKELKNNRQEYTTTKTVQATTDFVKLQQMAKDFDLPVPDFEIVGEYADLERAIERISLPCMIKVVSGDVMHRSDQQMVQKVDSIQEIAAFIETFSQSQIAVCKLAESGIEVFIGIKNDSQFGLTMLVGSGGVYSEVWKDIVSIPLPASAEQILNGFKRTKIYTIINGFRNKVWDTRSVIDTSLSLQRLALSLDSFESIEINPLIVNHIGASVVDIKISLS